MSKEKELLEKVEKGEALSSEDLTQCTTEKFQSMAIGGHQQSTSSFSSFRFDFQKPRYTRLGLDFSAPESIVTIETEQPPTALTAPQIPHTSEEQPGSSTSKKHKGPAIKFGSYFHHASCTPLKMDESTYNKEDHDVYIYITIHDTSLHVVSTYHKWCRIYFPVKNAFDDNIPGAQLLFYELSKVLTLSEITAIIVIITPSLDCFSYYGFRHTFAEHCKLNNITCRFVFAETFHAYIALATTKTILNEGEKVIVLDSSACNCLVLVRFGDIYKMIDVYNMNFPEGDPLDCRRRLIKDHHFAKIIWMDNTGPPGLNEVIERALELDTVTKMQFNFDVTDSFVKHIIGLEVSPYMVLSPCLQPIMMKYGYQVLFKTSPYETVPYQAVFLCSGCKSTWLQLFAKNRDDKDSDNETDYTVVANMNPSSANFEVNFILNENFLVDVSVNVLDKFPDKIKVVFGKNDMAVYVADSMHRWKPVYGEKGHLVVPSYINLAGDKPIVGEEAQKALKDTPTTVIYDIMKLSELTDLKNKDKKWKFVLKKKDKNEIVVVIGSHEYKPSELIAILLSHIIAQTRKVLGNHLVNITVGFDKIDPGEGLLFTIAEAAKLEEIALDFA